MKPDPSIAKALARAAQADHSSDLPPDFAARIERLAYAAARAARPSAWVEWGIAGFTVGSLLVAAWFAQQLDPDLAHAWAISLTWSPPQLAAAGGAGSGLPALVLAAVLWLLMQRWGAGAIATNSART